MINIRFSVYLSYLHRAMSISRREVTGGDGRGLATVRPVARVSGVPPELLGSKCRHLEGEALNMRKFCHVGTLNCQVIYIET